MLVSAISDFSALISSAMRSIAASPSCFWIDLAASNARRCASVSRARISAARAVSTASTETALRAASVSARSALRLSRSSCASSRSIMTRSSVMPCSVCVRRSFASASWAVSRSRRRRKSLASCCATTCPAFTRSPIWNSPSFVVAFVVAVMAIFAPAATLPWMSAKIDNTSSPASSTATVATRPPNWALARWLVIRLRAVSRNRNAPARHKGFSQRRGVPMVMSGVTFVSRSVCKARCGAISQCRSDCSTSSS